MFSKLKKKLKRKASDPVAVPPAIQVKSDAVTYTAIHNKTEQRQEMLKAACYGSHMATLSQYLFVCKPCSSFTLENEAYLEWMSLCHENHLLPYSAEWFIEKKKPYARIPGGNVSKHQVYTALCCYRFAESYPPLVYSTVKLLEKNPELDFFQVLHFGLSKYSPGAGHSFTNVCNASYALYGNGSARNDLINTIGMKWWYKPNEMGDSLCTKSADGNATNAALQSYCSTLKIKVPVKNINDVVLPKYTPLYKVDVGNKEALKKALEAIK